MDITQIIVNQIAGSAAFLAGVAFLLLELFRRGVSRLSLVSYICFLASTIFLASDALTCVLTIAGFTALFGLLLKFGRRDAAQRKEHKK